MDATRLQRVTQAVDCATVSVSATLVWRDVPHIGGPPMLDSKIVGGLVVDGTGEEPYRADVGIKDGKIVGVRGTSGGVAGIESEAAETLDANGRIVTPGFVDIHTHYDG